MFSQQCPWSAQSSHDLGPAVTLQSDLPAPLRGCPSSCQQLAKHTQERWVQPFSTPWLNEVDFNVLVHRTGESETHSCWNSQEQVGCCHRAEVPTWVSQFSNTLTCKLPKLGLLGWKKVISISWSWVTTANISVFFKGKHLFWKILVHFLSMFLKELT